MALLLPCLRSDAEFSGRPSYGNVYAAVNAMAGHLNSFGPTAPVPKKRLERMLKVRKGCGLCALESLSYPAASLCPASAWSAWSRWADR